MASLLPASRRRSLTSWLCLGVWLCQLCPGSVGAAVVAGGNGHSIHIIFDSEENIGVRDEKAAHMLAKRSGSWSPDDLVNDDDDWAVHWDAPTDPPVRRQHVSDNRAEEPSEVMDKRNSAAPSFVSSNTRLLIGLSVGIPVLLLNLVIIYMCCFRKKTCPCPCPCLNPQKIGRQAVSKYVAGATVDEDGKVTYREITEKEREAMEYMAENF